MGLVRPVGRGRKNAACGSLEGLQAAGRWRGVGGHGQEKTRPRIAQGGQVSRFFRRLQDHHHGEKQNKQDNQAGVTSSRMIYLIGLLYRSRIPRASARCLQAAASSKVLYNALYGCHLWPRPPIPAYTRYFTAVSSILRRAGQKRVISCPSLATQGRNVPRRAGSVNRL